MLIMALNSRHVPISHSPVHNNSVTFLIGFAIIFCFLKVHFNAAFLTSQKHDTGFKIELLQ